MKERTSENASRDKTPPSNGSLCLWVQAAIAIGFKFSKLFLRLSGNPLIDSVFESFTVGWVRDSLTQRRYILGLGLNEVKPQPTSKGLLVH